MRKVLVVDDDADLRALYKQSLVNDNFVVDEVADVTTALELISQRHYSAIITDLLFPAMDGIHLIKKARLKDSKNLETPIVVLTNLDHGNKTKDALKSGATVCLFKTKHTAQSISKEVKSLLTNDNGS